MTPKVLDEIITASENEGERARGGEGARGRKRRWKEVTE
jgi:hypothetical protein